MTFNYLHLVGNAELIKQLNYAMIYRLVVQQAPVSRKLPFHVFNSPKLVN